MGIPPSLRPGAGPDQKLELFEFRPMIRDRVELLSVPVWWSRCVVCVSCVFCVCALLDRGLGPPVPILPPASGSPGANGPACLSIVSQSESLCVLCESFVSRM